MHQSSQVKTYLVKYRGLFASFLFLLVVGITAVRYYLQESNKKERQKIVESLSEIQYLIETKQYEEAFEGKPGIYVGLKALSKQKIKDKALVNLVNFYMALIYKEKQDYQQALNYLKLVSLTDPYTQSRAKCLEGDLYCELADYEKALTCYLQASKMKPNKFFTPMYWMKAAGIYEKQKAYDKAIMCYRKIVENYPTYSRRDYVEKRLARAAGLKDKATHA